MDKNFNDQELSDIMKEIEALEEDFKFEEEQHTTSDVIEELAQMEEKKAIPEPEKPKVVALEPSRQWQNPSAVSAMSFKVQGNINLELQFDLGGKVVNLEVSESGLTIHMEGGMTFTLPVGDKVSQKKAA